MFSLIPKGHVSVTVPSPQLTARVEDLTREEENLQSLITSLNERLDWITSGSREKFGVLTERRVVLVLDSYQPSHAMFGEFCGAVAAFIREQAIEITSFDVIR